VVDQRPALDRDTIRTGRRRELKLRSGPFVRSAFLTEAARNGGNDLRLEKWTDEGLLAAFDPTMLDR
jgi:hypothetical protein